MSWAHYLLQVNIYLLLFFAFYKLLLEKETFFNFNRWYLLLSGLLSVAIPFVQLDWFVKHETTQPFIAGVQQVNLLVEEANFTALTDAALDWGKIIVLIYLAGALLFLGRFLFRLTTLNAYIRNLKDGHAFSFFNKKKVDAKLAEHAVIDAHEDAHIRQAHSFDVLFFEVLNIITWFNPVIYLYKNAIRSIHEYLADEVAAAYQGNKEQYAMLLLSQSFKIDPHMLTNNFFNRSLLKKRIFMLHKQRSTRVAILKYGLSVPLFALTLLLSSATIRTNDTILEVAENLPVKETISEPLKLIPSEVISIVVAGKESPKVIVNNIDGLRQYLANSVHYPKEAIDKKLQGNALIKFTVSGGALREVSTGKSLGEGCDEMVMKSILGYTGFKEIADGKYAIVVQFRLEEAGTEIVNKDVQPLSGYQQVKEIVVVGFGGKPALTEVTIQATGVKNATSDIKIRGSNEDNVLKIVDGKEIDNLNEISLDDIEDVTILKDASAVKLYGPKAAKGVIVITTKSVDFANLEELPEYPGGSNQFRADIAKNIKYPKAAMEAGLTGTVHLNFTIDETGTLQDINVTRNIGHGFDEAAIEAVKQTKRWKPGMKNGKPVSSKYSFPVNFKLDKK